MTVRRITGQHPTFCIDVCIITSKQVRAISYDETIVGNTPTTEIDDTSIVRTLKLDVSLKPTSSRRQRLLVTYILVERSSLLELFWEFLIAVPIFQARRPVSVNART